MDTTEEKKLDNETNSCVEDIVEEGKKECHPKAHSNNHDSIGGSLLFCGPGDLLELMI